MKPADRARLVEAVQTNCHIADARHAADLSLCIYLLQMREFFRWERALPFGAPLARDDIGTWIAQRETLWSSLEERAFVPIPGAPGAAAIDPFDVEAVNRLLRPAGLLYGAGLAGAERPLFFVAELQNQGWRDGIEVLTAGHELARGLLAPPAALIGAGDAKAIVLRRESLARWCWEKLEAHQLHRSAGSAFAAVVDAYGLDRDWDAALPRCLDEQGETLVLHELGEHRAGQWLGADWSAMRLALPTRRADLYARAVRDQLADFEVTLPTLLDRDAATSIHFWFSGYEGIREALFPGLKAAYAAWRSGDGGRALRIACAAGHAHFAAVARLVLALHARDGEGAGAAIERALSAPEAVCPA